MNDSPRLKKKFHNLQHVEYKLNLEIRQVLMLQLPLLIKAKEEYISSSSLHIQKSIRGICYEIIMAELIKNIISSSS